VGGARLAVRAGSFMGTGFCTSVHRETSGGHSRQGQHNIKLRRSNNIEIERQKQHSSDTVLALTTSVTVKGYDDHKTDDFSATGPLSSADPTSFGVLHIQFGNV
jgi:hypothetical protein